jgi:hypothetical protein
VTRAQFVEYLGQWAKTLNLNLQEDGPLAGLPVRLDDALRIVAAMQASGRIGPQAEELRAWYKNGASGLCLSPTLEDGLSLARLCEAILRSLDESQLLLFALRCANWATLARLHLRDRRLGYTFKA